MHAFATPYAAPCHVASQRRFPHSLQREGAVRILSGAADLSLLDCWIARLALLTSMRMCAWVCALCCAELKLL